MSKLQEFASKNPEYWWWVKNPSTLSADAIVEGVLNYGQFDEKKELITLIGEDEFQKIFESIYTKKRSNLRKEARIYWKLYIDKHFYHV